MTINVTENPVATLQTWKTPPSVQGAAGAALAFQNHAVVIPASNSEVTAISINCGLPVGFTYRLMHASVMIAGAYTANLNEYGRAAQGQLIKFNSSSQTSDNIPFVLPVVGHGRIDTSGAPTPTDDSAFPMKLMYGGEVPNIPLTAEHPTTVCRLFIANIADTTPAMSLTYYLRFLRYTIDEDQTYAIHSPSPVTE